MTTMDQINQQTIASYLWEDVWPTYKMLPKSWSVWRDDKRSVCQMILNKVAVPVGVDHMSYCDAMLLGITNDKFCSPRSNFKQVMLEQFQGKLCNCSRPVGSLQAVKVGSMTCLVEATSIGVVERVI